MGNHGQCILALGPSLTGQPCPVYPSFRSFLNQTSSHIAVSPNSLSSAELPVSCVIERSEGILQKMETECKAFGGCVPVGLQLCLGGICLAACGERRDGAV